ncbi:unnamed protein product [Darwinula stevensoni]|uniref:Palmitoyltransferase n=1 Tax=Darwinula stevensoni TaxID=69355 RepID=A0A7R9A9J6_9CRUS|nr:unnamed protein product [Darwinula stevensoni]CAG0897466.1 unnamed protein product [Darwinula stevensoni]
MAAHMPAGGGHVLGAPGRGLWGSWGGGGMGKEVGDLLALYFNSLFYNEHFQNGDRWGYGLEIILTPVFLFINCFSRSLGWLFVGGVVFFTGFVIFIAHWIGIPYYWEKSPVLCISLIILGYWLMINIIFHFTMGVLVSPGYPPCLLELSFPYAFLAPADAVSNSSCFFQDAAVPEVSAICKKCIAPKPPRTHHCSVCNRCILKMDHHCPWLNNCVGHYNHRYFYLYMVYMCLGCVFILVFGFRILMEQAFCSFKGDRQDGEKEGARKGFLQSIFVSHEILVCFNRMCHHFRTILLFILQIGLFGLELNTHDHRADLLLSTASLCLGTLVILGFLAYSHGRQISRGETSIEAHINKQMRKQFETAGLKELENVAGSVIKQSESPSSEARETTVIVHYATGKSTKEVSQLTQVPVDVVKKLVPKRQPYTQRRYGQKGKWMECPFCNESVKPILVQQHMRRHIFPWSCGHCGQGFPLQKSVTAHHRDMHPGLDSFFIQDQQEPVNVLRTFYRYQGMEEFTFLGVTYKCSQTTDLLPRRKKKKQLLAGSPSTITDVISSAVGPNELENLSAVTVADSQED